MAVTLLTLKVFVGAEGNEYDSMLTDALAESQSLVDKYNVVWDEETEDWIPSDAPTAILDRAYKEVAADLFNRRNAPNGIVNQQFLNIDGVGSGPVRISRDPMAPAYKILSRWVGFL